MQELNSKMLILKEETYQELLKIRIDLLFQTLPISNQ